MVNKVFGGIVHWKCVLFQNEKAYCSAQLVKYYWKYNTPNNAVSSVNQTQNLYWKT